MEVARFVEQTPGLIYKLAQSTFPATFKGLAGLKNYVAIIFCFIRGTWLLARM